MKHNCINSTIPTPRQLYVDKKDFYGDHIVVQSKSIYPAIYTNDILLSLKVISYQKRKTIVCYFLHRDNTKIKITFPRTSFLESQWILPL